jgi:hypothetical protein
VKLRHFCFTVAAAIILISCSSNKPAATSRVDANDYDAFWLWAGVKPQPVLKKAKTIYLLAGEVRTDGGTFIPLRATPSIRHAKIWLVVRVETLKWNPQVYKQVLEKLKSWSMQGNEVYGIQIDFDARTKHLQSYGLFLRDLRKQIPANYKLGITGLLDWSAQGDPQGLKSLANVVDEIVVQIYQGRHSIPGYENYLQHLSKLQMPYRIGLVQNGLWNAPDNLESDPNFRGFVVFLLNPK